MYKLVENFRTFQGPEWNRYTKERAYGAKKQRISILLRETFEDWIARKRGERLCNLAQEEGLKMEKPEEPEEVVDENLFAAPTLEEATENLKQFQKILATNVQLITEESRRVDEKAASEANREGSEVWKKMKLEALEA